MMMWHYKAKRLPSFTEDVNHLLPGSPEIPSEAMPGKKSSLVCLIVLLVSCVSCVCFVADERDSNQWVVLSSF